ncbi:MAG: beta-glucanase precursor [Myxococcales bacterium]|nr:beta-glucanase precursor [Myxococcales bacterium]
MKPVCLSLALAMLAVACATTSVTEQQIEAVAAAVDYGDSSSETLAVKAWKAFDKKDYPEVLAYTRKCVDLYGEEGRKMNAELSAFEPSSTAATKWALNDVGTCLFIMGSAYQDLEMYPEAVEAYRTLVNDYNYAQCWDPRGWYWRPAEVAAPRVERYEYRP